MKQGIHPTIHQTKVKCSCGATYTISGTLETLSTEICMACHPHYTGKKKLVDTEGRVEKFMAKFQDKNQKAGTGATEKAKEAASTKGKGAKTDTEEVKSEEK